MVAQTFGIKFYLELNPKQRQCVLVEACVANHIHSLFYFNYSTSQIWHT